MKMKKWMRNLVIITVILCLTGCGVKESVEEDTTSQTAILEESVNATDNEDGAGNIGEEETAQEEISEEIVIPENNIVIEFETMSEEYQAEDGTEILTTSLTYPVVTIKDNEVASEKINMDILNYKEQFDTGVLEMLEMVRSDYEFAKSEEGMDFYSYSLESRFEPERKDDTILSFTLLDWSFTGGAHGNYGTTGVNYNAVTGDKITLETLTADREQFKSFAGEYFLNLSKTTGYQDRMFEPYDQQTLLENLFLEGKWYLGSSGITFFADPYMLGPYAAGTIDFLIPYEEFPLLKPEFGYQGNYERVIAQGNTVEKDLNGDGQQDKVLFGVNYSQEDYSAMITFQVDGKDVASDAVMEFPKEEYYLIDLDQNDNYIEIAILDYGPSDDPVTYFYRYLEDGNVIMLGSITDLWSSESCSLIENGLIEGSTRLAPLQTWFASAHWKLEGDKLEPLEEGMYYPYKTSMRGNNILKNVTVYEKMDQSSKKTVLTSADSPVIFVATDNKNWVELETGDERTFYLYIEEYSTVESDGNMLEATEVFDSLIIAD